tara:strand:+ start:619 stop:840 length:222 start_codon:yes stop_codon:yes gene_type:complete
MTNLTQLQRIKNKLRRDKMITRNQCLNVFPAITRLSAHIQTLEEMGWTFETENFRGDYRYFLKEAPPEQIKLL